MKKKLIRQIFIASSSSSPKYKRIITVLYFHIFYSQIWLYLLFYEHEFGYITNLEKKRGGRGEGKIS